MSGSNIEQSAAVPEYELEQYFPRRDDLTEEQRQKLRERQGIFRTFFATRPRHFREVQQWLNQSRIGLAYDVYLAQSAFYATIVAALSFVVGVLLTVQLATIGVFSGPAPFVDGGEFWQFIGSYRVPLLALAVGFLAASVFGGATLLIRYYYPLLKATAREHEINVLLPHAIIYMYALSHGGMNAFEVIKELADADDVYGEVANEFEVIVRDVELFSNDLFTAIRDARNRTPSENLEQFLDDMLSVLDSGSEFDQFLEGEAETYMEEARQEQANFLQTLSVLSEIFVVVFVAAPLFLIVTLLVVGLLGGEALFETFALVYVVLPLGMLAFLALIHVLSRPFAGQTGNLDIDDGQNEPTDAVRANTQFEEYQKLKRRKRLLEAVQDPIATLRQHSPLLSLVLTVPVALGVVAILTLTGIVTPTVSGFEASPIETTIWLAVVPFFLITTPLTVLFELQYRRRRNIARRFPDTLNLLSSANRMGIRPTEALELVARWSEGVLSEELRKVRNDIRWNYDLEYALLSFADRLRVSQVTRTMKLVAKGSHYSSDLGRILSIAAEDTRNRYRLEQRRRDALNAYLAIVIIGFLVYLAVIVMLEASYLQPIGEIADSTARSGTAETGMGGFLDVSTVPVDAFRTVFFHSALIQGAGIGLLGGKLATDETMAGLKYSLALVTLALIVFLII